MDVDVLTDDPRWGDITELALRVIGVAAEQIGAPAAGEVVVLATSDARIKGLNAEFRGKPQATNVLSWPAQDLAPEAPGALPPEPEADPIGGVSLGDIALAYETCASEAKAAGIDLTAHTSHLLVHGFLHLLGFDHETEADAALMEGREVEILQALGHPNPYEREAAR